MYILAYRMKIMRTNSNMLSAMRIAAMRSNRYEEGWEAREEVQDNERRIYLAEFRERAEEREEINSYDLGDESY